MDSRVAYTRVYADSIFSAVPLRDRFRNQYFFAGVMKWLTKPDPKEGDEKERLSFAFWPQKLNNGYTIWLEFYYEVYRYELSMGYISEHEYLQWVLVENKTLNL